MSFCPESNERARSRLRTTLNASVALYPEPGQRYTVRRSSIRTPGRSCLSASRTVPRIVERPEQIGQRHSTRQTSLSKSGSREAARIALSRAAMSTV